MLGRGLNKFNFMLQQAVGMNLKAIKGLKATASTVIEVLCKDTSTE